MIRRFFDPAHRHHRRRKRRVRTLLLLAMLLVGGYWLFTDSFLTRRLLLREFEKATGAHFSATSVTVTPLGNVDIDNLAMRVPGVAGQAGEVFRVKNLRARVHLLRCIRGDLTIYDLALDQPVARVSRSASTGTVNIASLVRSNDVAPSQPAQGGQQPAPTAFLSRHIPTIAVSNGILEVGEHFPETADQKYTILKQLFISGTVDQSADDTGASVISFRQADPSAPESGKGLLAVGRVSQDAVTLSITGIDLGNLTPANVPEQSRQLLAEANLAGRVPSAEITYSFAGSWTARVSLDDVALTLPVEAQPDEDADGNPIPVPDAERGARLRLQRTSGELILSDVGMRGALNGQIENLPYEVMFAMQGTSATSPWTLSLTARDVLVHEQPQILKFAPGVARRRIREFSDPKGRVDAKVDIVRTAADAPLRVVGSIDLKGLTAAFHKFPYPFRNLRGTVTFDESEVRFHNIRGEGDKGATVVANGYIRPPTDDAEVRVEVRALGMPIDQTLRDAMEARGQEQALDELFNVPAYEKLIADKLIRPDSANATDPSIPIFDLGGTANVGVIVTRAFGPGSNWDDRIDIEIPEAGMLLRALPYPLIARNVKIVQANGRATVEGGWYGGIRGGTGEVLADVDLEEVASSGDFVPVLSAKAKGLPIDDLLLAALPDIGPDDDRRPLSTLITPLGPVGTVDATIELGNSPLGPEYNIRAEIKGELRAPPPPATSADAPALRRVAVEDFTARVQVTEAFVKLDATGLARPSLTAAEQQAGITPARGAAISANLFRRLGETGPIAPTNELLPTDESLRLRAARVPLGLAVEDFVRGYSDRGADAIAKVRSDVQPTGVAQVDLRVDVSENAAGEVDINLSRFRDATMSAKGLALTLDPSVLQFVRVTSGRSGVAGNYVFSGTLDDHDSGRVRIEGVLSQPSGSDALAQSIILRARDIELQEPTLHQTLRESGAATVADTLSTYEVAGVVDADLTIDETPSGVEVAGSIRPHSLAFNASDDDGSARRVDIPNVSGLIRLRPARAEHAGNATAGEVDGLALFGRDWNALITGTWGPSRVDQPQGTQIDALLTTSATSLSPDLRAILPDALGQAMSELNVRVNGPMSLAQAPLSFILTPAGQAVNVNASGSLAVSDVALDLGIAITQAEGVLEYRYTSEETPGSGRASVTADLPSLRASNVAVSQARLNLFTEPDGRVIVPRFEARAHGGRIAGMVDVGTPRPPASNAADETDANAARRPFDLTLDISSVRFAPLLNELRARNSNASDGADSLAIPAEVIPDASRGALSGSFSLHGTMGDRSAQRGRGTFRVEGGNILDLPTLVPLVRVTNLQLPVTEELDQATADFFVLGTRVGLEQLAISSKSVSLFGYGTATWPDLTLDLRMRTANRSRIPLVTEVIEHLRDELSSVRVQGPIDKPEIITERFSGTREALADLFGQSKDEDQRRLDMIQRSLTSSERRERAEAMPAIEPN